MKVLLVIPIFMALTGLGYQISQFFDEDTIRLKMRGLCSVFIAFYISFVALTVIVAITLWSE